MSEQALDKEIGHNRNLNKIRAAFVAFFGLFPLLIAFHLATFLHAQEFYLVYALGGIGVVLLGLAAWIWTLPPRTRATLAFTDTGFFVAVDAPFRHFEHDILWSDLREVRLLRGGYGVRVLDVVLTHAASERLGLVQTTTRKSAPDLLVGRKLSIPLALLAQDGGRVIAVLSEAADRAGFAIAPLGWREYLILTVERFSVVPKGDQGTV